MELEQGIHARKSIRGFCQDPVAQDTLRSVLTLAVRAVSTNNTQPWEFSVVSGEVLQMLRSLNQAALSEGRPADYVSPDLHGAYLERARAVGKQLFAAMEIARDDRERRSWWGSRGYAFFDAPTLILLYMDGSLDESTFRFDMGCVAQNICLAAMAYGLGTCVEEQAVNYQGGIHELLGLPPSKRLVCGIAIGYPDEAFPANQVQSTREPVDSITQWHGFEPNLKSS